MADKDKVISGFKNKLQVGNIVSMISILYQDNNFQWERF